MIPKKIQNTLEKRLEAAVFFREILILDYRDNTAKWEKMEGPTLQTKQDGTYILIQKHDLGHHKVLRQWDLLEAEYEEDKFGITALV